MDGPTLPASPTRSLLPQEHGAWGQLAMPLLTGLLLGRPGPAALLLAAATVLAFLAHEPWLVVLGHRGVRAQRGDGGRARRVMASLLAGAVAAGLLGAWLAPSEARLALLLPATLALVVVALVLSRLERTVPGELAVVTALASSGLAVALAGGASPAAALAATATWVLAFASSVFAVQVVLTRARSRGAEDPGARHALLTLLVAGGGAAAAWLGGLGPVVAAAVAPTALLSLVVCLGRFSPARLKALGWSLVAATSATLLVLLLGLRGA